jgi:hypothetical protein
MTLAIQPIAAVEAGAAAAIQPGAPGVTPFAATPSAAPTPAGASFGRLLEREMRNPGAAEPEATDAVLPLPTGSLGDGVMANLWSQARQMSEGWRTVSEADAGKLVSGLDPSDPMFAHKMMEWQFAMDKAKGELTMPVTIAGMVIKGVNTLTRM